MLVYQGHSGPPGSLFSSRSIHFECPFIQTGADFCSSIPLTIPPFVANEGLKHQNVGYNTTHTRRLTSPCADPDIYPSYQLGYSPITKHRKSEELSLISPRLLASSALRSAGGRFAPQETGRMVSHVSCLTLDYCPFSCRNRSIRVWLAGAQLRWLVSAENRSVRTTQCPSLPAKPPSLCR